jgi:hypothetical protein
LIEVAGIRGKLVKLLEELLSDNSKHLWDEVMRQALVKCASTSQSIASPSDCLSLGPDPGHQVGQGS